MISLFMAFLLVTVSSCQKDDMEPYENKVIELDEKSAQLIEAENEFGFELYQHVFSSETKHDNIMVSPLSVSPALAMTYNGANGETKTAMEKTLKVYGLTPVEINKSYQTLVKALKNLDKKLSLKLPTPFSIAKVFRWKKILFPSIIIITMPKFRLSILVHRML